MRKTVPAILLYLSIATLCSAQNLKYRRSNYSWEPVPARVVIEDRYKSDDAVILDEETKIEMVHDNVNPYNYYLTKKMRIRFQSEASLKIQHHHLARIF